METIRQTLLIPQQSAPFGAEALRELVRLLAKQAVSEMLAGSPTDPLANCAEDQ